MSNNILDRLSKSKVYTVIIGKDNQHPSIDLNNGNLNFILMLLRKKVSLKNIAIKLAIDDDELISSLKVLEKEGLIEKDKFNTYLPKCMVISWEDSEELYHEASIFVDETIELVFGNISRIKEYTSEIKCFNGFLFKELSLFILSDVIMDTIQIENVEKYFLKKERPLRNGKNYYLGMIEQKEDDTREAFGWYGNMIVNFEEFDFCMYGNYRMSGENLFTLSDKKLKEYFTIGNVNSNLQTKKLLLQELIKAHKDSNYVINNYTKHGFNQIRLMKNDEIKLVIMNEQEYNELFKIAEIILDRYINIFNKNKILIENSYIKTGYINEVSFEEYFMFWYHFYYTLVTERLIELKYIKLSQNNSFSYIIEKSK